MNEEENQDWGTMHPVIALLLGVAGGVALGLVFISLLSYAQTYTPL